MTDTRQEENYWGKSMEGLQVVVNEVSRSVYLNKSHDYIFASYFTITLDLHIPFQYIFVSDALLFITCKNTKPSNYMKNYLSITSTY